MKKLIPAACFLIVALFVATLFLHYYMHAPTVIHPTLTPTLSPTLANPASMNCTKKGGTLLIKKRADGGEYGLCDFGDNMQCEEWALYRGDCPVGGRKTTGYDVIEQKYCAWLGGTTYAVTHATCALPNGHTCLDTDLYEGTCQ